MTVDQHALHAPAARGSDDPVAAVPALSGAPEIAPPPRIERDATVVIADDHHLARAGLRHVLDRESWLTVVGEARDGAELVELVARTRPDLALADLQMPIVDGIEATRRIRAAGVATRVVLISSVDDPDLMLAALRAGADGYALADIGHRDLGGFMRRALAGTPSIETGLATSLLQRLATSGEGRLHHAPEPLTTRETQVLQLIAQGRTNREIASRLLVAVGTVKIHVEHILQKLGAIDRTHAAARAVELGLAGLDERDARVRR